MPDSAPSLHPIPISRLSLFWQLQLAGWTGFSIFTLPLKQAFAASFWESAVITAFQLPLALACSIAMRWFFHRTKADRQDFTRIAVIVLVACLTAALADVSASILLNQFLGFELQVALPWSALYAFRLAVYLIWSLGYFLIKAQLRGRDQAFQAAVTEERHRLELLRYQLNPNFLAKSLATISHEIGINPAIARAMTARLAGFYQNTLRHTDRGQAPTIGDELALVRAYLEIEQLRLGSGALILHYAVDESLFTQPLPPVMLLPLAERAVRSKGSQPMEITVTIQKSPEGQILLEISHSGRLDRSAPPFITTGEPGMAELRASLDQHFAGRYRLNLSQDSFQVRASLYLPLAV
jgi:two-component system sensor histidine kinase AlgZ